MACLAERFCHMKLKDEPITCTCGATGEEISELFEALQLVEPTILKQVICQAKLFRSTLV